MKALYLRCRWSGLEIATYLMCFIHLIPLSLLSSPPLLTPFFSSFLSFCLHLISLSPFLLFPHAPLCTFLIPQSPSLLSPDLPFLLFSPLPTSQITPLFLTAHLYVECVIELPYHGQEGGMSRLLSDELLLCFLPLPRTWCRLVRVG